MDDRCFGSQESLFSAGPFRLAATSHPPGMRLPDHAHDSACLHFVLDGIYEETHRGEHRRAGPGSVLFKPAGEPHSNAFGGRGARTLRIEYGPSDGVPELGGAPIVRADPRLQAIGAQMQRDLIDEDEYSALSLEGLCLEALATLGRSERAAGRVGERRAVRRAARALEERWQQPVSLTELASEIGVHRSQLSRAFRHQHGCSMGEFLRRVRVQRVMEQLEATSRSIARLAAEAGFSDQSHLCRVFRRIAGVTPGAYRRAARGR